MRELTSFIRSQGKTTKEGNERGHRTGHRSGKTALRHRPAGAARTRRATQERGRVDRLLIHPTRHHRHDRRGRHRPEHQRGDPACARVPPPRRGRERQGRVPQHRGTHHREPRRQDAVHPRRRARCDQGVSRLRQGPHPHPGKGRRLAQHRVGERQHEKGPRPLRQRQARPHPVRRYRLDLLPREHRGPLRRRQPGHQRHRRPRHRLPRHHDPLARSASSRRLSTTPSGQESLA